MVDLMQVVVLLVVVIVIIVLLKVLLGVLFILPAYATTTAGTTYTFSNCEKKTGTNFLIYYCYANPPHQKTALYLELANP